MTTVTTATAGETSDIVLDKVDLYRKNNAIKPENINFSLTLRGRCRQMTKNNMSNARGLSIDFLSFNKSLHNEASL